MIASQAGFLPYVFDELDSYTPRCKDMIPLQTIQINLLVISKRNAFLKVRIRMATNPFIVLTQNKEKLFP